MSKARESASFSKGSKRGPSSTVSEVPVSFSTVAEALRYLSRPVSQEELERRRQVVAEILKLREEIGPIDLTMEELLAEDDGEG